MPEEPLYAGEQYYLDLAGNIRKGPVGVGYTCYCAPFFKELEARLDHNTKKLKRQISRTEENINRRLCSVEKHLKRPNEKLQQVNHFNNIPTYIIIIHNHQNTFFTAKKT